MKLSNPQLSALEMHYVIKDIQLLIGSKVDKIYHPEKNTLILQLHKTGTGKNLLKLKVPGYLCMTQTKESTQQPSQFCAYLRKKLSNSFLELIEQKGFERIVELKFRLKEGELSLVFEFFSPGNIILTKDNQILSALEYQEYKDRKIKPKEEYKYPTKEYNFLELTENNLMELLKKTDKSSVVKALAIDLGLGGLFAEEACLNSGVDKDKKPNEIREIKNLFESLKSLRDKKAGAWKSGEEILPFELRSMRCERSSLESFSQAIDESTKQELPQEQMLIDKRYQEKVKKINTMINSQETVIKNLSDKEQELREKGDMIYSNFQKVEKILNEAKKEQTKDALEKMKKEKIIKNYDLKEKTITLELE